MRTIYPDEPIKDFKQWREYIRQQVLDANERRVIAEFIEDIKTSSTPKKK
jgi:hypothetical protein|tara:strand:- start:7758 stop:7907 length:150 start_codon:yes stop_codon:yes gene_type:complete